MLLPCVAAHARNRQDLCVSFGSIFLRNVPSRGHLSALRRAPTGENPDRESSPGARAVFKERQATAPSAQVVGAAASIYSASSPDVSTPTRSPAASSTFMVTSTGLSL